MDGLAPPAGESQSSRYSDFDQRPNVHVARELIQLLDVAQNFVVPFVGRANGRDHSSETIQAGLPQGSPLVEQHDSRELAHSLNAQLGEEGKGKAGFSSVLDRILRHSVNTWDQGFMSKLYSSTNPIGIVSEYILAVLNTNLHVYEVSPILTRIEQTTSRTLAALFGLEGPFAGGVSQPGGSASNLTALVVARNTLFPHSKSQGYDGRKFVMLASADSHYSLEKAAQVCGFGSSNVWSVPVDAQGCMRVSDLESMIRKARDQDLTPFFVCATAGTTVLGSYDPLPAIATVCKREDLWFHVDASWGGAVVFSSSLKHRMAGSERANTLAFNPHKMLGVPVTCSFLLTPDLRQFKRANTINAGYLFHQINSNANSAAVNGHTEPESQHQARLPNGMDEATITSDADGPHHAIDGVESTSGSLDDLGDLTLQCGRKGDSLKLFLGWLYYGKSYYGQQIEEAFATAAHLANLVNAHPRLLLLSERPPPCLQVCFYYVGKEERGQKGEDSERNTWLTKLVAKGLAGRGFMIDYAPGKMGMFLRAVVHLSVKKETVEYLVRDVVEVGDSVVGEHSGKR